MPILFLYKSSLGIIFVSIYYLQIMPKNTKKYVCKICDYITCDRSNYKNIFERKNIKYLQILTRIMLKMMVTIHVKFVIIQQKRSLVMITI